MKLPANVAFIVIFYGAFGTNNMFKLYPILPWCFLIGAILGAVWVIGEKVLPPLRQRFRARMTEEKFSSFDRYVWKPVATSLACLNPAIALSGALNWAGNNNLVYGKSPACSILLALERVGIC
jgi:hypothetical protein